MRRVRESGSSYRKKRAKRQETIDKLSGSMNKYVNIEPKPLDNAQQSEPMETNRPETESNDGKFESSVDESESRARESELSDDENESQSQTQSVDEHEIEQPIEPNVHDPHTWPDILTDVFREQIIKSGLSPIPYQHKKYPQHKGRSFHESIFYAKHVNGTNYKREWLVYSKSSDSVYCLFCALFNRTANAFSAVGRGYSNWKNITRDVANHENTLKHHTAFKTWLDYGKRLETNQTIDAQTQKLLTKETDHWKEVMKRLVASVQFLAQQSLAFRGHTSTLYDKNNGNFLKLMEMLAKFDPVMADHLNRATTTNKRNYLSNRIQNELIECLATSVTEHIINAVTQSKYYAIMVDCTSDLSHIEQMTIILRYVTLCSIENKYIIEERFLTFVPCTSATGEGITKTVIGELKKVKLDLQDCRGQGYDNEANMAGHISGVQTRILEMISRAKFVPCACHKLNLMVNDTAKIATHSNSLKQCKSVWKRQTKSILGEMQNRCFITFYNDTDNLAKALVYDNLTMTNCD